MCKDIPTWLCFLNLGSWHHTCALCEIAAHKTAWKIIWSIEGLHSRDKFRYPITVTDVTLTLIKKKPSSLVENETPKLVVIIKTSLSRTYQNETQKYRSWFELHKGESAICTINTQKLSLDMKIYLKYQRAWPLLSCHSFSITMLWSVIFKSMNETLSPTNWRPYVWKIYDR